MSQAPAIAQPAPATGRVCMDLRPGDRLSFDGLGVELEVVAKSGRATRLQVVAPRDVTIRRVEARVFDPSM